MSTPGTVALPAPRTDFDAWWSAALLAANTPATSREREEAARLSIHFPNDTRVIVTPARGSSWRGIMAGWTEPGSGRLMAIVKPTQGPGAQEPMHVLPRFVVHPYGCTVCHTK